MYLGANDGGFESSTNKWAGRCLMKGTPGATVELHRLMGYSYEWE